MTYAEYKLVLHEIDTDITQCKKDGIDTSELEQERTDLIDYWILVTQNNIKY